MLFNGPAFFWTGKWNQLVVLCFVVVEYHFLGVRKAASIKRTLFTSKVIFVTDLKKLHVIPSIVFRQKHSSGN